MADDRTSFTELENRLVANRGYKSPEQTHRELVEEVIADANAEKSFPLNATVTKEIAYAVTAAGFQTKFNDDKLEAELVAMATDIMANTNPFSSGHAATSRGKDPFSTAGRNEARYEIAKERVAAFLRDNNINYDPNDIDKIMTEGVKQARAVVKDRQWTLFPG